MRSGNVARRVVEKFDLKPPIDIAALLQQSADVVDLEWSQDCDGLVVGLTGAGRPKVFVRSGQHVNRDRFTRAHEWGHIMIPWHLGDSTLDCEVYKVDPATRDAEREANDFASRVLVPDRYLTGLVSKSIDVKWWLAELEKCEVSAHATLLALVRDLPSGFAFLLDSGDGGGLLPIRSSGTVVIGSGGGTSLREQYSKRSLESGFVRLRGRGVHWFRYIDISAPVVLGKATAADALEAYIKRAGASLPDGRSRASSIHGVISGKLRDKSLVDVGWMHGILMHHIESDPTWSDELENKDFREFLSRRVIELAARRSEN